MVLAGKKVAECLERLGLGAVRQFLRPPGLANQARGAVAIAFGKQDAREREPGNPLSADKRNPPDRSTMICITLAPPLIW